jgi:hypothetical protein
VVLAKLKSMFRKRVFMVSCSYCPAGTQLPSMGVFREYEPQFSQFNFETNRRVKLINFNLNLVRKKVFCENVLSKLVGLIFKVFMTALISSTSLKMRKATL